MDLNEREIAILFWLTAGLGGLLLTQKPIRDLGIAVVKAFFRLLPVFTAFTAYVIALIVVAHSLGIWRLDLLNDSLIWFVVAGIALMVNANRTSESGFFRRTALATLGLSAFLEFYVNVFVLPLPAELALQPVLFMIGGMSVVAASDPKYHLAKVALEWILAIIGLAALTFVTFRLVQSWATLDLVGLLTRFTLPVWLTLGVLPFIYGFSLAMNYQSLFFRVRYQTPRRTLSARARFALLLGLNFRNREVARFGGYWLLRLAETASWREARAVVAEYRRSREAQGA